MQGMAEEYLPLAYNLNQSGQFLPNENVPFLFRPPGYIFFLTAVMRISDMMGSRHFVLQNHILDPNGFIPFILFIQKVMLGLSATLLYLYFKEFLSKGKAVLLAVLFGCNPYMIILSGFFHYEIFHLMWVMVALCSLLWAFHIQPFQSKKLCFLGACGEGAR